MAKKPHSPVILQTGTYSSWNKGDAAMQLSTAAQTRQLWPDAEIIISAPFPDQDGPFYEGIATVVPCYRRRLIFATLQIVRAGLWRLVKALTGKDAKWIINDRELLATRRADLVIDLSGDMLTDDYGPHVAYSHYIPLINALLLDRPVFICAQSVGPFKWTGWLARWIFLRAKAVTVRDEISIRHLESIGVPRDRVELTADMAFLLEPAPSTRVNEILASENIEIGKRPLLGVSLSRILEKRHASAGGANNVPFVQLLARVLDEFAAKNDMDVVFVPHVTGPTADKDDRNIGRELAAAMTRPVHVLRGDYRPEELKGIIARCDLFLGARMHANIGALSSAIPVVALSYSHKTPGIMRLFNQENLVIAGEALSADLLQQALGNTSVAASAISKKLAERGEAVRADAGRNMNVAGALLSRS